MIWDKIKDALQNTCEGIGFLNYSYYNHRSQIRYQPDILLVSREWGIAIIEVKTFEIHKIQRIQGNQWFMSEDFYKPIISPIQQAEKQAYQLLKYFSRQGLKNRVPVRVLAALPCISISDWEERFSVDHPSCPPIIFGDRLGRVQIRNSILQSSIFVERGLEQPFNDREWELLINAISPGRIPQNQNILKPVSQVQTTQNRGNAIQELEACLMKHDIDQIRLSCQIPPGPQRIRGIAGSGKTVILCQRALHMHLAHPDWDIALVFFNKSLHDMIPSMIQRWFDYMSSHDDDLTNQQLLDWNKLKVLHAWGSDNIPGFYSTIRNACGVGPIVRNRSSKRVPQETLVWNCKRLLEMDNICIPKMFDAVLIDEGQDLAYGQDLKFEDKQAFYWLVWQSLKPVVMDNAFLYKRLIWAYDEAQSLESLTIPSYSQIFGEEYGKLLSGQNTGPSYTGGIQKNEIMKKCYRTPMTILVAAHAIGMGLLRQNGMICGPTQKRAWNGIGYDVEGDFRSNYKIKLTRPSENSPSPAEQLWNYPLIDFKIYQNYDEQFKDIADLISHNINHEGLQPSRDILVVILGSDDSSLVRQQLTNRIAIELRTHQISYYYPGSSEANTPELGNSNNPKFWMNDAVTLSNTYKCKGHEANMIYIIGLESLGKNEDNIKLRNQIFVSMTRSRFWVHMSGIKDEEGQDYPFYKEVRSVLDSGTTLEFYPRRPSFSWEE